jgi:DNA-binding protein HU-beta
LSNKEDKTMAKKPVAKATVKKAASAPAKKAPAAKKVESGVGSVFSTENAIRALAEKSKGTDTELTNKAAGEVIDMFKAVILEALSTGQKVQLTGFLTFEPSYRKARQGNNVATNETMEIPESIVINAKAGKSVKDAAKNLPKNIFDEIKAQAGE